MSGGGKGGSQSTKVEIPQWLEDPSKRAIQRGEDIAQIGYMPYMGPDVAAFSPTQEAAFNNTNAAANAFGMAGSSGTGMPAPTDFGGVQGYSSYPVFQGAVDEWAGANPDQAARYNALFGSEGIASQPVPVAAPSAGGKNASTDPLGHMLQTGVQDMFRG